MMHVTALLCIFASVLLRTSAFRMSLPGSSLRFGSVMHKNINQLTRAAAPQHTDNEKIGIGVQASRNKDRGNPKQALMNKTPGHHDGPSWTYEMEVELFSLVWRYKQKYGVAEEEIKWEAIAAELGEKDVEATHCEDHYAFLLTLEYEARAQHREPVPIEEEEDNMTEEEWKTMFEKMPEAEKKAQMDEFLAEFKEDAPPEDWAQLVSELKKNPNGYQLPASLMDGGEGDDEAAREEMFGKKDVPKVYGDIDYSELE